MNKNTRWSTFKLLSAALLGLASGGAWAVPIPYSSDFGHDIDTGYVESNGSSFLDIYDDVALGTPPGFDTTPGMLNSLNIAFTSRYGHNMGARTEDRVNPLRGEFNGLFDLRGYAVSSFVDISRLFLGFQIKSILYGLCRNGAGERCTKTRGNWFGRYFVRYDYTPGVENPTEPSPKPVPEPGTLLLFAMAILGARLLRR